VRSTEGRRASPMVLLVALAGFLGIAAVVVLILVVGGNGSGSSSTTGTLPDANVIAQQFDGIPQAGNVLGKTTAPATMVEYIDLQCPVCRAFETEVMPTIIDRYVRTGKLKVEARPIAIIGPDSERGRHAMIAAERQNRAFNFAQLLYFNQGAENSGWLDDSMVAAAARSIPGVNVKALEVRPGGADRPGGRDADGARRQDGRQADDGHPGRLARRRGPERGNRQRAQRLVRAQLAQALVADAEVVRDLVDHHVPDLLAQQAWIVPVEPL